MNLPTDHDNIPGISDLHEIGRGGFGVVYRAQEEDLGRTVAIKILTGNFDERARSRFDRERRAMGTLSGHPNIVHVYRSGYTPDGTAYIVMEYHLAGSCADLLNQHGPMPWRRAVEFGVALCGAVETAHRAGVLHRDIKPGNILMSRLHQPKLADFGIARIHDQPETRTGSVTASVAHAAPEVLDGQRAHAGTDVYSLASTLYELVAGAPAFTRPTDESIVPLIARIARDPLPGLSDEVLPAPVFSVLDRAMNKNATERYRTAEEFGRALAGVQGQMGLAQTPMMVEGEAAIVTTPRAGNTTRAVSGGVAAANANPAPTPPPAGPAVASAPTPNPDQPGPVPTAAFASAGFVGASAGVGPAQAAPGHPPANFVQPGSPKKSNSNRYALAALAVAALFGVGALIGFALTRSDGGERASDSPPVTGEIDRTTTTSSSTTSTSTTTSTTVVQPQVVLGAFDALSDLDNLGNLKDYGTYDTVTDDTGVVTVDVPHPWMDRRTGADENGNPLMVASGNIDGLLGAYDNGGVQVAVFGYQDPVTLLNTFSEDCVGGDEEDDGLWNEGDVRGDGSTGLVRLFIFCANADAVVQHSVFNDADETWTAVLSIQMVDELDVSAGARLVSSLEINAE